jgi:hypothetical protein
MAGTASSINVTDYFLHLGKLQDGNPTDRRDVVSN